MFNTVEMLYTFAMVTKKSLEVYTDHPMVKQSIDTYYEMIKTMGKKNIKPALKNRDEKGANFGMGASK